VGTVPLPTGLNGLHFVELELLRGSEIVSTNTYWIPGRKDVMDLTATSWLNSPTTRYADLTKLAKLPPATVNAVATTTRVGPRTHTVVSLENNGKNLAFFVRLTLRRSGGPPVVPVFWSDNYVTLRPGAKRSLTAVSEGTADESGPMVEIEGINIGRTTAR
jgi:exo-1,4-beta-D-glucosaminidase